MVVILFMLALCVSLGQTRNQTLSAVEKNNSDDFQSTLSETCLALNAKCHACIERLVKEDAANPHKIENMDIDKFINEIDPDIWKAVCLLTQPRSSQAIKNSDSSDTPQNQTIILHMYFAFHNQ